MRSCLQRTWVEVISSLILTRTTEPYKRDLEATLEPELRQIADLEAEIEREQKLMDQDMASHRNLKNNAATQEKIRKEKARSVSDIYLILNISTISIISNANVNDSWLRRIHFYGRQLKLT